MLLSPEIPSSYSKLRLSFSLAVTLIGIFSVCESFIPGIKDRDQLLSLIHDIGASIVSIILFELLWNKWVQTGCPLDSFQADKKHIAVLSNMTGNS